MIEEGEKGRFRFHNNCNYLAFEGKQPCIMTLVCTFFMKEQKKYTKSVISFYLATWCKE